MKNNNEFIKNRIIRDTAKYNLAHYSSQFFGFFTSVVMRRFLGPYYTGIWNILQVVMSYFSYLSCGLDIAASYKVPFYRGKNDKDSETETIDSVFTFLLLSSVLAGTIIFIAAFILRNKYPQEVIIGLFAIALIIILQRLYTYYVVILRARSNFSTVSKSVIFDSIVNLILVLCFVTVFKIYGLYLTVALMPVLNVLFIHYLAKYKIRLFFNWRKTLSLIKYSLSLSILGILGNILRSIDRIMIAKMLGITFVGYYSIALLSKNYVVGMYNNFGIVTIPRLFEAYGRGSDVKNIKKFVVVTTETISYLLPPFLAFIFLISPFLIKFALPNFMPGIIAMQIILFDVFFQACSPQLEPFLVAVGKQRQMILINIITIIIAVLLNYYFIKSGLRITGVAIAASLSSFFYFLVCLFYAMLHFATAFEITKFILKIMFPLVYIVGILLISDYSLQILSLYVRLFLKLSIIAVGSIPLMLYIDRKHQVIRVIYSSIRNKNYAVGIRNWLK